MVAELARWIQNLQQNQFNGTNNVRINYAVMLQPAPSPAIIVCNGRIESYLKYSEFASELFDQGYSVYLIDHRGQGLSERITLERHQGHIIDFEDYIKDLALFIDQVVAPKKHLKHLLFGHSMGGAIATRYIETSPHFIDKLIVASPMFGIVLPLPVAMTTVLVRALQSYAAKFSSQPTYVLGGRNYVERPFARNCLTQSPDRYKDLRAVYQLYPEIQLGAPTNQWLLQAIFAAQQCVEQAHKITIPTLLLQAGADRVVKNKAQNNFAKRLNPELIEFVKIEGARHELLFELDCYREPTMAALFDFAARD